MYLWINAGFGSTPMAYVIPDESVIDFVVPYVVRHPELHTHCVLHRLQI